MANTNAPLKITKDINIEKRYSLFVGIYFSILFFCLLLLLVFVNMSVAIQQVIVAVIGVLIIMSFYSFKKVIEPESKKYLLNPYPSYFDNRVITYNTTTNQNNSSYEQKYNLAEAAAEIQKVIAQISQNYSEKTSEDLTREAQLIEPKIFQAIENIETDQHEKLNLEQRIIVAKTVENIEKNSKLKKIILKAAEADALGGFRFFLPSNISGFVVNAAIVALQKNETNSSDSI